MEEILPPFAALLPMTTRAKRRREPEPPEAARAPAAAGLPYADRLRTPAELDPNPYTRRRPSRSMRRGG